MSAGHKYRQYLIENEAHPEEENVFVEHDQRDSFATVYLSIVPFIATEYFFQRTFPLYPGGLLFPMGFLLFWSYYYTFYRPNQLEERLNHRKELDLLLIPTLILGTFIWFFKVTVMELLNLLVFSWLPAPGQPRVQPNYHMHHRQRIQSAPESPVYTPLPRDVQAALKTLGLQGCRNWKLIHHRYRELAKQYHPDLNPEITEIGRRFMAIDCAYKRLARVKSTYFYYK